jgi:hypothetical protein
MSGSIRRSAGWVQPQRGFDQAEIAAADGFVQFFLRRPAFKGLAGDVRYQLQVFPDY